MWFVNNFYKDTRLYAYDYVNDKLIGYGPDFANEDDALITPVGVYSVAEDMKGNIWLASTNGPFYIPAADALAGMVHLFNTKCHAMTVQILPTICFLISVQDVLQ